MSKRPHSELEGSVDDADSNKRNRINGQEQSDRALLDLIENADDLIESLTELKRYKGSLLQASWNFDPEGLGQMRQRLSQLSNKLSPSFQTLGNAFDGDGEDEPQPDRRIPPRTADPPVPQAISMMPWKSSEIPTRLPPLPRIKDPDMEQEVFIHKGLQAGRSYERLEWIGDAYLELFATTLIAQTFPHIEGSGERSQVRELLVRNTTLADYFRQYSMQQKAQLPPDFNISQPGRGRSADKDLIKTQGDMFEAYVAAVILSDPQHGLETCIKWMRALWSRTIKEQIIQGEKQQASAAKAQPIMTKADRPLSPKERLAQILVVKGVKLRYVDQKEKKDKFSGLPLFVVGVTFTGWGEEDKLLGVGTARNKTEAGQKAASQALENKKLMKMYGEKKQAFLAARNEGREGV